MEDSAAYNAAISAKMAHWMTPDPVEPVVAEPTPDTLVRGGLTMPLAADLPVHEVFIALALSGRVSPDALGKADWLPTQRLDVLNQVVEQCAVDAGETGVRWLLKQPKRLAIVQQLIDAGTLAGQLAGPLPATDRFGDRLRELLQMGAAITVENRPYDDLLALMEALETTKPLNLPQPDWTQIRREIGLANFLTDQRTLLANGFVGRETELKALRTFVADTTPPTSQPWNGLVLTGLGGSGKSTLLARFSEEVVQQKLATLVVFDFDRPGLNPDDRLWLESELARQVGYQYPDINEALRQERANAREQKERTVSNIDKSSAEYGSVSRSIGLLGKVAQKLAGIQGDGRPLLLLMDTFEEVEQQDLTENLLAWLREVADLFSSFRLRIIFSGRLFDAALDKVLAVSAQRPLDLGELSDKETRILLKRFNVSDALARRVAKSTLIPHRPLELKLLARMLAEKGDATLDEIETELRTGGDAARSLFMGLVYRRVLMRINDDTARKLAYPGLVLRFVTTDLILHVLAPVLGLKLTDTQAQAALDVLARHSWICYRTTDGEVWHRKDLRRSMLSAMRAQEPELAKQISEAAFAYFSRLDTAKTDTRLQAEQTYHRLLWLHQPDEGAAYDLPTLKSAAEFIGADTQDLPKAATILLQYAQKGRVKADEVEFLPAEYFQKAYDKTGQRLIDSREFGKALRLYQRHEKVEQNHRIQENKPYASWEMDTLFATANWEELDLMWNYGLVVVNAFQEEVAINSLVIKELTSEGLWKQDTAVEESELHAGPMFSSRGGNVTTQVYNKNALIYLVLRSPFVPSERLDKVLNEAMLSLWTRELKHDDKLLESTHLQRKLLYVELLIPDELLTLTLAPSLLKIDPIWLEELVTQPFMKDQLGQDGRDLRQMLLDARALLTRKTVRRTLDALDVLYKNKPDGRVRRIERYPAEFGVDLVRWFRGPDSEFRDPVRFALLDAFRTRDDYRQLAGLLTSVLALPFTDLEPDAFAEAMVADPEHFLEPYIEIVDRTWALGSLLTNAVAARPTAAPLVRVKAAYFRWDAAVLAAFKLYDGDGQRGYLL